jgi:hypothetical protein
MMATPLPTVLHVAATWGTTIITLRHLALGESFDFAMPSDLDVQPIRATAGAWEVDPRRAVAGKVRLRGQESTVAELGKVGVPLPITRGDYGLLQYGELGIFFQCAERPSLEGPDRAPEFLVALALLSSGALHAGALGFLRAVMTPPPIAVPLELDDARRLAWQRRAVIEPPPTTPDDATPTAEDASPRASKESASGATGSKGVSSARPAAHAGTVALALRAVSDMPNVSDILAMSPQQTTTGSGEHGMSLHGAGPGDGLAGAGLGHDPMSTSWGARPGGDYGTGTPSQTSGGVVLYIDHGPGGPPTRCLSADQVRRVVLSHRGALRACYDAELVRNPGLRGGVTLAWKIDPAGSVSSATVASSTIGDARVEGCVLRQVKSWRFPVADDPTSVASYPLKFGVGAL